MFLHWTCSITAQFVCNIYQPPNSVGQIYAECRWLCQTNSSIMFTAFGSLLINFSTGFYN